MEKDITCLMWVLSKQPFPASLELVQLALDWPLALKTRF